MRTVILKMAFIIAALTCLGTSAALAETNQAKPSVLSTSDFKNTVNKMSQETKNSLNQQATQQFIKQPPTQSTSAPPPAPTTPSTQPTPPEPIVAPQNTTVAPQSSYSSSPNGVAASPVLTAPVTTAPSSPSSAQLPSQNQPYTGFGTGNTTRPASPASSSSGGWNIKY